MIKSFVKKTLVNALPQKILHPRSRSFIFIYHDVSDPSESHYWEGYSTKREVFQKQIDSLSSLVEWVTLEELLAGDSDSQKHRAALTFDDGFSSVYHSVRPFLGSRSIPFSVFVNKSAMVNDELNNGPNESLIRGSNGKRLFMNEGEVQQLRRSGVTVGSHTSSHLSLSNCSDSQLESEIRSNKDYLDSLLSQETTHISLPYGKKRHYNGKVLDTCRRAGHQFIYSSNPVPYQGNSEESLIPRIGLTNESPKDVLYLINRTRFQSIDI